MPILPKTIFRMKLIAALLLAVSLCLPQYSCTKTVGPDGKTVQNIPKDANPAQYHQAKEHHYVWSNFDPVSDPGALLLLLAFLWPLPVLAMLWRSKRKGVIRILRILEFPLAAGSIYLVWVWSSNGTREWGAYLALFANAVYVAVWAAGLWVNRQAAEFNGT